jgi:hypothetical protein
VGHERGTAGQGPPVLDIGGDIGALVLYTPPDLAGQEIEVSPLGDPGHRTHTEVLQRTANGRTFCAAVYAALPEGRYRIWFDDTSRTREFAIAGGEVTQLRWT